MVTPVGYISIPVVALQNAIAGSATFQAATNTVGVPTAALEKVKIHAWTVEDVLLQDFHLPRPFAIVHMPQMTLVDQGGRCYYNSGSQLGVYFSMDHPYVDADTPEPHGDGFVEFANFCAETLREAIEGGGPTQELPSFMVRTLAEPMRVPRSERGTKHDFWGASFALTLTG